MTQFPFETLLNQTLLFGEKRTDRTGTGTRSLFAPQQLTFDLRNMRVPLITSKRVPWKMATAEFLWMLSGSTAIAGLRVLSPVMATVWSNWADEYGDIGPTYGAQYRNAGGSFINENSNGQFESAGVDQLERIIDLLANRPDTRRAVISLWSAPELDAMQLEPCMVLFQFSLRGENYDQLDLHIYQRSADLMLGVPFDLYQGGLLTHLVARELSAITGKDIQGHRLTWSSGDVHIYENQLTHVQTQLDQTFQAEPMRATMVINAPTDHRLLLNQIKPEHIIIQNYRPEATINAAPVAV